MRDCDLVIQVVILVIISTYREEKSKKDGGVQAGREVECGLNKVGFAAATVKEAYLMIFQLNLKSYIQDTNIQHIQHIVYLWVVSL